MIPVSFIPCVQQLGAYIVGEFLRNLVTDALGWLLVYGSVTCIATIVVMGVCCRYTRWGRAWWRVNGDLLFSAAFWKWWLGVGGLFFLLLFEVRVTVFSASLLGDVFNSLQENRVSDFWRDLYSMFIIVSGEAVCETFAFFAQERLALYWRRALTQKTQDWWLARNNYYYFRFLPQELDNPDQRVDLDTAECAHSSLDLLFNVVPSVVLFLEAMQILWGISPPMGWAGITLGHAVFWITLAWSVFCVTLTVLVGKPLVMLNFRQKILEANYRFSLASLRMNSREIALAHDVRWCAAVLREEFAHIVDQMKRIIFWRSWLRLCNGGTDSTGQLMVWGLQAIAVVQHKIKAGDVLKTQVIVQRVTDSIRTIRSAYDTFTEYEATLVRLNQFFLSCEQVQALPQPDISYAGEGLSCHEVSVMTREGAVLVSHLNLNIPPGQSLLIQGESGVGKSTTLTALAGFWLYMQGNVNLPARQQCIFLPQQWYLPPGDLRTIITSSPKVDPRWVREVLAALEIEQLCELPAQSDWSHILSPGQVQRVALARVILAQPHLVFLDEATSALTTEWENRIYQLMREYLPQTTIISTGHHRNLVHHHDQLLVLHAEGMWEYQNVSQMV